jgi:hypothetical protein
MTILRGSVKFSGTNMLTRILLTLQYAISLIAIISGFIFAQNANYQNNYDFGFDMESVVYAFVKDEPGYTKMRNGYSNFSCGYFRGVVRIFRNEKSWRHLETVTSHKTMKPTGPEN